jgi:hypothetical protein
MSSPQLISRKAVAEHVKTFFYPYGLNPDDNVDIYPFSSFRSIVRPSERPWEPDDSASHRFIYVSPSIASDRDLARQKLMFVKYHDPAHFACALRFCGTLRFSEDKIVFARFHHRRKLCGIKSTIKIQLLDVFSLSQFFYIETSNSFKEVGLQTGSIVVAQEGTPVKEFVLRERNSGLAFPPYGMHCRNQNDSTPSTTLGKSLYRQAVDCQFVDVAFLSLSESVSRFRLTAHKNVLATVPYFKAAFQSGMKESKGSDADPSIVELKAPPWTTRWTVE